MASLDDAAKEAGIIMMNECGVDPGTDHMSGEWVVCVGEKKKKKQKCVIFLSLLFVV